MRNLYNQLSLRKLLFFALVILFVGSSGVIAQCTFTIPALAANPGDYYHTTYHDVPYTQEAYYGTHYNWVCAGDTVEFVTDCCINPGNQQTGGFFILESGSVFILDYSVAGWSIVAKAGSKFFAPDGGSTYNDLLYDTAAVVPQGWGGCCNYPTNNWGGVISASCPGLTYDYSLITPGTGCLTSTAPATHFSANPVTVCAGDSVAFTDQSTGSPTSWNWTFTGGTPGSSAIQNPKIYYGAAGIYTVKLVVTNSSGSDSLTKTGYITVNPLPVAGAITGPKSMCSGDSVQLSDTGSSGAIQWQSSADEISFANITGSISSVDSIGALTQTTYYRVNASNGCGTDSSATFKLLVNALPVPVVTADDSLICSSDSTQVCTSGNFVSYSWNTTNTPRCITVKDAGSYYVFVTDTNGCSAQSNHISVSVYPVTSVSIIQNGDTLSSFGQRSYQWLLDGNPISNATGALYVAQAGGSYSVAVIDTNGCTTTSNAIAITGVSDLSEGSISLYPNPSTGSWYLEVGSQLMGSKLEVYDDNGRIVFQSEIGNLKSAINLNVAKGVYWLRISNANVSVVRKMVKL